MLPVFHGMREYIYKKKILGRVQISQPIMVHF